MKRNIMTVAFVAAIALIAGINVYNAQKTVTLSDIAMENVEALASNEGGYAKECEIFPHYSFVGTTFGVLEERRHIREGWDVLVTYDVEYCIASGKGTLKGVDSSILSRWIKDKVEVECDNYHY